MHENFLCLDHHGQLSKSIQVKGQDEFTWHHMCHFDKLNKENSHTTQAMHAWYAA